MAHYYNDPTGGKESTVGKQLRDFYYARDAITEVTKEQYFTPLASTTDMPMHYGKRIVRYVYVPLLDDRNINDQGIDGAIIDAKAVGISLFGPYVLAVELASMLLLAGLVVAYHIGREQRPGEVLSNRPADAVKKEEHA